MVYVQDGGEATVGGASADGGRTWSLTPIMGTSHCSGGRDGSWIANPFLAVGAGGVAYHGSSWLASGSQGVAVHRWDHPGISWGPGVSPDGDTSAQNANVAADPHNRDSVAMMWTHFDNTDTPAGRLPTAAELRFARSSDGGQSFSAPVTVVPRRAGEYPVNSVLRRDHSSGDLVAIYSVGTLPGLAASMDPTATQRASLEMFVIRSTDNGDTWSDPVLLGTQGFVWGHDPDDDAATIALLNGTTYVSAKPDLAIGPHGQVAVAWTSADSRETTAVELALSDDRGETWTRTQSQQVTSQVIEPAVAFSDKGTLGVFFYDHRNDIRGDDEFSLDAWLQVSADGGERWQEIHLGGPFDLRASNSCSYPSPLPAFERRNCELLVDGTELGVYQDLIGLENGFGAAYTVTPPLTRDGFTDVVYSRVLVP